MQPTIIHDKSRLEEYLLKYPHLNFYHLGDLDDFFWPYTTWYAWEEGDEIQALNLFYTGIAPPVLLAIENGNQDVQKELLKANLPFLPPIFYSHLSPGLEQVLEAGYTLDHRGEHYKMRLDDLTALEKVDTAGVEVMGMSNIDEMRNLYEASYPGNWFDPRMVETGQYVGIRDDGGRLVGVAGIHVYSQVYKIAALGNITILPELRGHGIGTKVTAGLCQQLLETVKHIGLNVKSSNAAAIRAYEKIGFGVVAAYHEYQVDLKTGEFVV